MRNKMALALMMLLLSACVTTQPKKDKTYITKNEANEAAFYRIDDPIQCVPYAREQSGLQIYGDAHTWWHQAKGKYERSQTPKVGAVMVLSKTTKLKYGHLAVVTKILGPHEIEVTHSNWGNTRERRCVIYNNMRVQDISRTKDWSVARFWNYEIDAFGLPYAVSGFIYPPQDMRVSFLKNID